MAPMRIWGGLAILATLLILDVSGDGIISIRFIRYENVEGEGENGQCCDGRKFLCQRNGCDHMFNFCLDDWSDSRSDTDECSIFQHSTSPIMNQNQNEFGDDIGGLANPVITTLDYMPEALILTVHIEDQDDLSDNEVVDFIRVNVTEELMMRSYEPQGVLLVQRSRTIIMLNITSSCNENYHGVHCDIMCEPSAPDSDQHFDCHPETGEIMCSENYYGPGCDVICVPSPPEAYEHFGCDPETGDSVCQDGWMGESCDEPDWGPCTLDCPVWKNCVFDENGDPYCDWRFSR